MLADWCYKASALVVMIGAPAALILTVGRCLRERGLEELPGALKAAVGRI